MLPIEFLAELEKLIGGEVDAEEAEGRDGASALKQFPRLETQYRGVHLKADFVVPGELLLKIYEAPPYHLLIRRKGLLAKLLGSVALAPGVKTGDAAFDRDYVVMNVPKEKARQILTDEVKGLLRRLEPFVELTMTHMTYSCLKHVTLPDYKPARAVEDLDTLLELIDRLGGGDEDV